MSMITGKQKKIPAQRKSIAGRVKAVRLLLGINQTELAAEIGVSRATVNRWENESHVIGEKNWWRGYHLYRQSLDKFNKFEAKVRKRVKR